MHDDGDDRHSFERTATRLRRARPTSGIAAAIEADTTGVLSACGHAACAVAIVGDDAESELCICYNTDVVDYGDVHLPSSTKEALSGPQAEEWRAAYARDLSAKIKNGTFTLVKRPTGKKVIRTKVAHALKRDTSTNAITELRARWVGMGFLQGPGDFKGTYTATPTAASAWPRCEQW